MWSRFDYLNYLENLKIFNTTKWYPNCKLNENTKKININTRCDIKINLLKIAIRRGLKFIPLTIQLRNHVHIPSPINGRTKESFLRVLREIDIPATLTYEAYSRCRENGSSPFVPRKSQRNLTSQEETGKASRAHIQTSSSVYRCTKRDRERKKKGNKKMRGKRYRSCDEQMHSRSGEQRRSEIPRGFA